jgi:hypothetical protein
MTAGSAAQPEVLRASNIQAGRHKADGYIIQHQVTKEGAKGARQDIVLA